MIAALIAFGLVAVLVVVSWFVLARVAKKKPTEIAERTDEEEFLGQGDPGDPRR